MSTNFFQTKWSDRGALEKGLILGGSIFATIVLVRNSKKLIQWIKTIKENKTYSSDENTLSKLLKPTYMDSQYIVFANALFAAMDGIGTDEVAVGKIMYRMKNDLDVNKLIQAYGKKEGDDLSTWITSEFDAEEDKDIYVNAPLRANKIKTQF
jgi:hypothetical protein